MQNGKQQTKFCSLEWNPTKTGAIQRNAFSPTEVPGSCGVYILGTCGVYSNSQNAHLKLNSQYPLKLSSFATLSINYRLSLINYGISQEDVLHYSTSSNATRNAHGFTVKYRTSH